MVGKPTNYEHTLAVEEAAQGLEEGSDWATKDFPGHKVSGQPLGSHGNVTGQPTPHAKETEILRPWTGLFKQPTQDFHLAHILLDTCRQERKLSVPSTIVDKGSREWQNTIVGFFLDRKLPYSLVTKATTKFWGNAGLVDTLASDQGTYFFKFDSGSTLEAVLEGGPWYVAGKPIILRKWEPHLSIEKDRISKIPIWVHFYNIPLEYWSQDGLSYIASMIGKPLLADKMTASRRRITYARICIEVDASEEWISSFELEAKNEKAPITIKVEYQWTPTKCSICKCFGHDCNIKARTPAQEAGYPPAPQQWIPVKNAPSRRNDGETIPTKPPDEEGWTDVTRKGKTKVLVPTAIIEGPRTVTQASTSSTFPHVKISNSFNELIPYVYEDRETDCSEASFEDDTREVKGPMPTTINAHNRPTSSRQKKKEAKAQFSKSRPKGRHRA